MVLCSGIIMCCCELKVVTFVQCDSDLCVVLCNVTDFCVVLCSVTLISV